MRFFGDLFRVPFVRAAEDMVDPQDVLRKECESKSCMEYKKILDKCNERVNSKKQTEETCTEELIDLFHCVDHCSADELFSKLK